MGQQSPLILIDQLYLTTEGIFGIPAGVSATYVILFIIFGALVERTGTGQLFMDFALALDRPSGGGPGQGRLHTSGLFGTVSGSAVANVMTTGTFTIPLMRKIGYRPAFAGAVEAVASTGGQIMPPIMGAAAFVMAEFLGVSYLHVAAAAADPGGALLPRRVHVGAFRGQAHRACRACRAPICRSSACPQGARPSVPAAGRSSSACCSRATARPIAALCGIVSVVPTALLRRSTRAEHHLWTVVEGLIAGARNTVAVALACACAGIVVGVITLTGLGIDFTASCSPRRRTR